MPLTPTYKSFDDIAIFIKKENDNIRKEIASAVGSFEEKLNKIVDVINGQINHLTEENIALKDRISDLEEKVVRQDKCSNLLLKGVPCVTDEDVYSIYNNVSSAIGFNESIPVFVKRFKPKPNTLPNKRSMRSDITSAVILIRFPSALYKTKFMSKYLQYGKLSQMDVGFKNNTRLFIGEDLTACNYGIVRKCSSLKREGKLSKYFTRDGLVFVCFAENSHPVRVSSINDLRN